MRRQIFHSRSEVEPMGLKNLIINVINPDTCDALRDKLHAHTLFKSAYDGSESTHFKNYSEKSRRLYYYDLAHTDLTLMLKILQGLREGHELSIKIHPGEVGNHDFDVE